MMGEAGGGKWSRESRPRIDTHPLQAKIRWQAEAMPVEGEATKPGRSLPRSPGAGEAGSAAGADRKDSWDAARDKRFRCGLRAPYSTRTGRTGHPHRSPERTMIRIWHPSKSCPGCASCRIHLALDVSFADLWQAWRCRDCSKMWLEPNGILASNERFTCRRRASRWQRFLPHERIRTRCTREEGILA